MLEERFRYLFYCILSIPELFGSLWGDFYTNNDEKCLYGFRACFDEIDLSRPFSELMLGFFRPRLSTFLVSLPARLRGVVL